MNKIDRIIAFCALSVLCIGQSMADEMDFGAYSVRTWASDFKTRGIATADRMQEDSVLVACNNLGRATPKDALKTLEQAQLAMVRFPADGKYVGSWQNGDRIAQNGRGMTWSDSADAANGGNCYNCHQITKEETSFGTMGPSLYRYGALRGNSPEIQKYTYGKIFNAKAYNLCSSMPRFGHVKALTEQQIKDLVALLLDPESPVNK